MGTDISQQISLKLFKRTKIIATVGPSTNSYEQVEALIKAGANGIRLNFSHGTHEEREAQIKWIRRASKSLKKPVAIIQDLQGPKIRLGDFDNIITIAAGQEMKFKHKADYARSGLIPIQYDLSKKIKKGERLFIADGTVRLVVSKVEDGIVCAIAENDGILIKRKGINVPDTDFDGDIITSKDKKDIAYGSTADIDYVALSFVQSPDDVVELKKQLKILGSSARVIAKIETKSAVDHLEEIVKCADAVMVARGDLATETMPESVPIIQRKIIGLGLKYAKPSIVATQMLASMVDSSEPTRAEVSDVATAVLVGADSVMLSDETASGKYPIESVAVMKRIVRYTEANPPLKAIFPDNDVSSSRQTAICKAIIDLAINVEADGIVAETKSGATALQIAANRPNMPIIAVTSTSRVAQQLAIVYGIKSYERPDGKLQATKLTNWLRQGNVLKSGDVVVTASGQHPGVVGTTDTIKVRILE